MKKRQLTLVFALSALAFSVLGQDYTFKVLANKGANEVKQGDTWQPLKTGASLRESDEVKLADNAYLGLVHASGKPMELKQAGTFKVNELAKKVGGSSSVLNKYTDFILSSNSAEAKKNRLNATGAVQRKIGEDAGLHVYMPDNQNSGLYDSKAVISWDGSKISGPYVVKFMNVFEEELFQVETPETSVTIDLKDPRFPNDQAYLFVVQPKQDAKNTSGQHMIKKLNPKDQDTIKNGLTEFMADVDEANAIGKIYKASFFEKNNLIIDAITAYDEAVKLEPSYQEQYDEFLLRHKLKKASSN
jgi:hypothetical protein